MYRTLALGALAAATLLTADLKPANAFPAHPIPAPNLVEKAQVVVRERVYRRPYGYHGRYGRPYGYYNRRVYRGPHCRVVQQRVVRYGRVVVRSVRRCY
jgi:hypothetical protein